MEVRTDARAGRLVLVAVTAGALVSLLLGVYGKTHTPTGGAIALFGFGSLIQMKVCLLYTSPSPRDGLLSRMPSSA